MLHEPSNTRNLLLGTCDVYERAIGKRSDMLHAVTLELKDSYSLNERHGLDGNSLAGLLPKSWFEVALAIIAITFLGGAITFFGLQRASASPGPDSVDVGFLHDMISHHEQALTLSEAQIIGGGSPEVQVFAREILRQQSREIGLMEAKLNEWGYRRELRPDVAMEWMGMSFDPQLMPGMASESELQALFEASGDERDALFLALMIDHHIGGVNMASAATSAEDSWVQDISSLMERNQAIEIREMEMVRDGLGLTVAPNGFDPGPFPQMSMNEDAETGMDMDLGDG